MEDLVRRRLQLLIAEASSGELQMQDVSKVMRVVSNYATLGQNVLSQRVKQLNRRVSKGAYALLLDTLNFRDWSTAPINGHQVPLAAL